MKVNFSKSSINIQHFYELELGKQLKPNTWNNQCLCPFHSDKNAGSFGVHTGHGGFKCYSCGAAGGDVIDFLTQRDNLGYLQAEAYLSGAVEGQPEKNIVTPPANHEQNRRAIRQALVQEWDAAWPASPNHSYLKKKRIKPHGAKQNWRDLLLAGRDSDNQLQAIQHINENGDKWFSKGSYKRGSCFFLAGNPHKLIICEGFSTGAALAEQTGYSVAVAFDAGNLKSVAVSMRESQPSIEIIIAADNDRHHKDGTPRSDNPGLTAATKAAKRINARLAVPEFPDGVMGSDFNDLALLEVSQ